MKYSYWIIFIFISNPIYSQIKIDSIIHELENGSQYQVVDTVDYLMAKFIRYTHTNKSRSFDIYLDSAGRISKYIGLSLVQRNYDTSGRLTLIIGYNKNGEYYFWDFPPITKYSYSGDTTFTCQFDKNYKLISKEAKVFDAKGRTIALLTFNLDSKITKKEIRNYNNVKSTLTTTYLSDKGEFTPNSKGVSIIIEQYENSEFKRIVEKQFLDLKHNLVDEDHENISSDFIGVLKYSKLISEKTNSGWKTTYYNQFNKIICYEYLGNIYKVISNDN